MSGRGVFEGRCPLCGAYTLRNVYCYAHTWAAGGDQRKNRPQNPQVPQTPPSLRLVKPGRKVG